ncbi:hypothetical protein [Pseudothioclava nitratireducens]|uniref:hypothetical protein n=1 Tax=Pseudothioclava nitratireducens TaxID=1928646 RepID=UPI0023DBF498|nr:hypothetical protein [Defluviimonas nitratireducens]MDF1619482.1 hypothetical protein [Defluviimonas nitratireducens]
MQQVLTNEDGAPRAGLWAAMIVGFVVVGGLFWLTWKSQFAAPPGYLFGTPTQAVESGYCLAVAQDVVPGGALSGSYFDEAAQFWVKRLRSYGGDIGGAVAQGRAHLGRDLSAFTGADLQWLRDAMDGCSTRAVNYGARFRVFD